MLKYVKFERAMSWVPVVVALMLATVAGPGFAQGVPEGPAALTEEPAAELSQGPAVGQDYVLGPLDRLTIRVNSLRRTTGEIYTWQPLSSEFSVAANGTIFMPIIGQLGAEGKTPETLATDISLALKNAADLTESPFTSVEVMTYRPYFVLGAVQSPGQYDYQPGMTVLQAISTAEGFARSADSASVERDAAMAGGDIRSLGIEGSGLEGRLVRFAAESAGSQDDLVFAPEFVQQAEQDPRIKAIMQEEIQRFNAGKESLAAELEVIASGKVLLQQELVSLSQKSDALDKQLALFNKEVEISKDLLDRGLTVSSRQISAENDQLAIQSNVADVQVATLRARQNLQQLDRDAIDLRARYRKDALDNLVSTRAQIQQNLQAQRTARDLLTLALSKSLQIVDTSDAEGFTPEYRVVRITSSGRQEEIVGDDFGLLPGDVLQVGLKMKADAVPQVAAKP